MGIVTDLARSPRPKGAAGETLEGLYLSPLPQGRSSIPGALKGSIFQTEPSEPTLRAESILPLTRSPADRRRCIKSKIEYFELGRNVFCFRKLLQINETAREFRMQALAFFVFSSSGSDLQLEEPQNGLRPLGEIPDPLRSHGAGRTTPKGLCLTLRHPEISQHRPSTSVFFPRIRTKSTDRSKNRLSKEFNLLVSDSPWPMERAVAPGGKSLIFHGGVGPGGGLLGMGSLEVGPSSVRIWSWSWEGRGGRK